MSVMSINAPINDIFMEREEFIPIFCGDCQYCPTGKKRFCKLAGHNVCKTTPAHNCKNYKFKNIVED